MKSKCLNADSYSFSLSAAVKRFGRSHSRASFARFCHLTFGFWNLALIAAPQKHLRSFISGLFVKRSVVHISYAIAPMMSNRKVLITSKAPRNDD
jgi:hypothetical protein